MRCSMLLLLASLLLSACANTTSEVVTCPSLVPYSAEVQDRAAAELDLLGPHSTLKAMMDDYGDLRAQVKACLRHS